MQSISDLTTYSRKTKGHVPPPLVGASTTVIGDKMYLFGGRLVAERRMTSDLYVFDFHTLIWSKLLFPQDHNLPAARYFHSADTWNDHLVIFGGMGYVGPASDELCVLSDVRFFSIDTQEWIPPTPESESSHLAPRARYAHLSSVTSDRLFIIGGQDMTNVWLNDIHVLDLASKTWVLRRDYPRHCGTYRSVAVAGRWCVRSPADEEEKTSSALGPAGKRFLTEGAPPPSPTRSISEQLVHMPYSAEPSLNYMNDIHIYSNYNFTDVKRELEVITPNPSSPGFTIDLRSHFMSGVALPPGLRFPTGAIIGSHLIIAGTYLAHSYQSFSIWALDLEKMSWLRIDTGAALATGSWNRGVLWGERARYMVFGNRAGNLVEDYNRRLLCWDHVACVDLEASGIYQPPRAVLSISAQTLGLAALEEAVLTDFEIICDDGRRLKCSRRMLEERWPWFKEQRRIYLQSAERALATIPGGQEGIPLPSTKLYEGSVDNARPDPRLTPRALQLSEPYPIALAFLQYLYSLSLLTPLQHAPPVLSALLLLSTTYDLSHLQSLVKHAMHRALSPATSVGVYEVATLCGCQSLQIRYVTIYMCTCERVPELMFLLGLIAAHSRLLW
ncbi:hypothetical protein BOTBODRAFT_119059 [Botryobasidium botryosum FD-172 SS1]|uniref:BTB domain-containing protein n=1 Tax=Botryobasidium botryosum (strain FD-172 SS1) TaxID=930990 RepID=A0A067M094_BOTB1|nr:hypothetical protein BOTBODRAFT_119059 [Botryobasidium botryosum FD-172 SS1]